jgi:hypothetical protein
VSVLDLLELATHEARRLLDEAYQRGYRNGLASASLAASPPLEQGGPAPPEAAGPAMPGPLWHDDDEGHDEGEDGEDERGDGEQTSLDERTDERTDERAEAADLDMSTNERPFGRKPEARPIASRATIATLRSRIIEHFALERFDVEVVLCRKGDANRRQLKSNVRLAKYLAGKG